MLTKTKKQESDKSARFTILEVQGMLKPNTCNCYTWLLTKVKKQESARFTILEYLRMLKLDIFNCHT